MSKWMLNFKMMNLGGKNMDFKVGDCVYASDWCYGVIVEIKNDIAHVEFEAGCGGGCLPFALDELKHASMISKLCYELYKVDWKHSHMITTEREMSSIKNYYEDFVDNETDYTYNDYLEEFGYDGELYVCYEEFLDNEYLEEDYVCSLLDNKKLITMYLDDIKK